MAIIKFAEHKPGKDWLGAELGDEVWRAWIREGVDELLARLQWAEPAVFKHVALMWVR